MFLRRVWQHYSIRIADEARYTIMVPMKNLLITTAALEVGAGVALICFPTETTALLLAPAVNQTVATVSIERIAGAALLTLGVANWLAHYDEKSLAAKGIVGAMALFCI